MKMVQKNLDHFYDAIVEYIKAGRPKTNKLINAIGEKHEMGKTGLSTQLKQFNGALQGNQIKINKKENINSCVYAIRLHSTRLHEAYKAGMYNLEEFRLIDKQILKMWDNIKISNDSINLR